MRVRFSPKIQLNLLHFHSLYRNKSFFRVKSVIIIYLIEKEMLQKNIQCHEIGDSGRKIGLHKDSFECENDCM